MSSKANTEVNKSVKQATEDIVNDNDLRTEIHLLPNLPISINASSLCQYGQQHLLDHLDVLTEHQRSNFCKELNELDLDEVIGYFKHTTASINEVDERELD